MNTTLFTTQKWVSSSPVLSLRGGRYGRTGEKNEKSNPGSRHDLRARKTMCAEEERYGGSGEGEGKGSEEGEGAKGGEVEEERGEGEREGNRVKDEGEGEE